MLIFTCVGTGETNIMHDLKSGTKVKQRDSALTDLRSDLTRPLANCLVRVQVQGSGYEHSDVEDASVRRTGTHFPQQHQQVIF